MPLPQYVGGKTANGYGLTANAGYAVALTGLTGGSGSQPEAGDLVIVVSGWAYTADGNPGVTTAGYTESADLYANDSRDANLSVSYKIMGGTPDTSVSAMNSPSTTSYPCYAAIHVWRHIDPSVPLDVAKTTATGIDAARPNSPAITPLAPNSIVLTCGLGTGDASPVAFTAPAGYGNAVVSTRASSSTGGIAVIASKIWGGSGAEDPGAWGGGESTTSDSWAAVTLALRPKDIAYGIGAPQVLASASGAGGTTVYGAAESSVPIAASGAAVLGVAGVGAGIVLPGASGVAEHTRYEVAGEVRDNGILVNRRVRIYSRDTGALISSGDTVGGRFRIHVGLAPEEVCIIPIHLDPVAVDFAPPVANRVVTVLAQDYRP